MAILVPLAINASIIRAAGINLRLFLVFLLVGLLSDLAGWYASHHDTLEIYFLYTSFFYSLFESVFFIWLIKNYSKSKALKQVGNVVLIIIGLWSGYTLFKGLSVQGDTSQTSQLDVFYQVAVSFLGGFTLLSMAEKEEQLTNVPMFWIFTGIFFYCFSTFFIFVIKSTLENEQANRLWPIHNIVNIITYILYAIGLWQYRRLKKPDLL